MVQTTDRQFCIFSDDVCWMKSRSATKHRTIEHILWVLEPEKQCEWRSDPAQQEAQKSIISSWIVSKASLCLLCNLTFKCWLPSFTTGYRSISYFIFDIHSWRQTPQICSTGWLYPISLQVWGFNFGKIPPNTNSPGTGAAGRCQNLQIFAWTGQQEQQLKDPRAVRAGTMFFEHWNVLLNMFKANWCSSEAGK